MIKRDFKISRPIWDFWENKILLDIEKISYATALDAGKTNYNYKL